MLPRGRPRKRRSTHNSEPVVGRMTEAGSSPVTMALDAEGGDQGPQEIVAGALEVASPQVRVALVGRPQIIQPLLDAAASEAVRYVEIVPSLDIISPTHEPAWAVRNKQQSSIVVGARLVGEGRADGFASAGSTGGMLAAGLLVVKRIRRVRRPAILVVLPGLQGPVAFLDAGANADCRPEYLLEFGLMGAAFASFVLGIDRPRVGLLNIGEEHVKGNDLAKAVPRKLSFCTFAEIYFARPDSVFRGRLVHQTRQAIGRQLAREAPVEADIVVPAPDSGIPHAIGYAQQSGIPYSEGLIKNRYIGRTFIQPDDRLRRLGVALKFNPLPDSLHGKRIVVVDDSIVRGTTSGPLVGLLRQAGAAEVHLRVASPPIRHPCFMGVDMATREELIAHRMTVDEIAQHVGVDSLGYLSLEGLLDVVDCGSGQHCQACFTGDYPVPALACTGKEMFEGKGLAPCA